jgi:predicted transcriptional regulator
MCATFEDHVRHGRVFLPDKERLHEVLRLLTKKSDRELLLHVARKPAHASDVAQRSGGVARSVYGRLARLARGGLLASNLVNGRRVYRLGAGVSVRQIARQVVLTVKTAKGSAVRIAGLPPARTIC